PGRPAGFAGVGRRTRLRRRGGVEWAGSAGRGVVGRTRNLRGQVGAGGTDQGGSLSVVVVVRVAQRGGGQLRRTGCRAMVRPGGLRYRGAEPVAALSRLPDRSRRLAGNLLATR